MRGYYIAGNWKMHKTVSEAVDLARQLAASLADCRHKLMIAPPFTALQAVAAVVKGTNLKLGAQNVAQAEQGAHTGEVSVLMLKDLGVGVAIVGHSERRILYGESDQLINAKVRLALSHGIEVILCVGETLDQREAGKVESVVVGQVEHGLHGIGQDDLANVTVAYEPVWAIGTGKNATPEDADAVHRVIRSTIGRLYSSKAADAISKVDAQLSADDLRKLNAQSVNEQKKSADIAKAWLSSKGLI